jgi:hypothetical protein
MQRPNRTPQEKKALSYASDRRNAYGESTQASRRNIALRKRMVNRANRRLLNQLVAQMEIENPAQQSEAVPAKRLKQWKKFPDQPLGKFVAARLARRARLGMTQK